MIQNLLQNCFKGCFNHPNCSTYDCRILSQDNNIEPIVFHKPRLSDKSWVDDYLSKSNYNGCEYSFGNLFILSVPYEFEIANYHGFLLVKTIHEGNPIFYFPAGEGDIKQVVEALIIYSQINGNKLRFGNITEEHMYLLEEHFPNQFNYEEVREGFDYIYLKEKLIHLSGKKYHGKRNHISRFKDNPNWKYEQITSENIDECKIMSEEWQKQFTGSTNLDSTKGDYYAVYTAFKYFFELGLVGGFIRQDGRIVALAIGERLNKNTFVIHIEKAFSEIQGAYAIINQEFARHLPEDIEYINREEDLGIEGLRRAKMSYRPEILLAKHLATYEDNM